MLTKSKSGSNTAANVAQLLTHSPAAISSDGEVVHHDAKPSDLILVDTILETP